MAKSKSAKSSSSASSAKSKTVMEMAKELTSRDKRQAIRFEPDPGTIAFIDVSDDLSKRSFQSSLTALVVEESYRGCGLVLKMTKNLAVGSICKVKVGQAAPIGAEVRWRAELDAQTLRVGLMFVE